MTQNQQIQLHMPQDLLAQCGNYELEIITQRDVKITDFVEPFGLTDSFERMKGAHWIFSPSIGNAFKICKKSRKIVEFETKNKSHIH